MLALISLGLALAASQDAPTIPLDRPATQRVVSGLGAKLDGRFLLTGLSEADAVCTASARCVSSNAVLRRARTDDRLRTASDLSGVLSAVEAGGAPVRYVVAVRAVRSLSQGKRIYAAVYDRADGRWRAASGDLRNVYAATGLGRSVIQTPTFTNWRYTEAAPGRG